ncbi:tumor necrosis factor receptor superfamily member 18 isoform X1 [Manis pentadactyla]|uniref:tumor necrosis factor receptor superfamily member 18 isoform X1 n=1 Tax=Manis pentadactyla TaxID=143292 RepID=UPI00255CE563|nr:tumor necrosis factor receptor superfamily member 18 isoform X1 [Manis pentadactyla]
MRTRGAQLTLRGVALLCALGLGQSCSGAPLCGPGLLLLGTGTDARCCRSCASAEVCPEQSCVCVRPEYHCGDPQCQVCKHHPCPPGQGVRPQGPSLASCPQPSGPSVRPDLVLPHCHLLPAPPEPPACSRRPLRSPPLPSATLLLSCPHPPSASVQGASAQPRHPQTPALGGAHRALVHPRSRSWGIRDLCQADEVCVVILRRAWAPDGPHCTPSHPAACLPVCLQGSSVSASSVWTVPQGPSLRATKAAANLGQTAPALGSPPCSLGTGRTMPCAARG